LVIVFIVAENKCVLVADSTVDVAARWGIKLLDAACGRSGVDHTHAAETRETGVVPGKTRVRRYALRTDGSAAARRREYGLSGFGGQRGRAGEA
jgi:hypothetical protein